MTKNSTPSLTQKQAIALLEAIPTDTLQGLRDFALIRVFFITGCRVSAIVRARVGDLEPDGVEPYLAVAHHPLYCRGDHQPNKNLVIFLASPCGGDGIGKTPHQEGPGDRPEAIAGSSTGSHEHGLIRCAAKP